MTEDDRALARSGSSPVRVLIVDDQETFRSVVRLVVDLTDGFDVVGEAGDGASAITLTDELRPDLVLMDIKMPGMDGIEATRRIMAANPDTRVVVLSTYDEFEDRAIEAGAVAFVSKSAFGPDQIIAAWQRSH